MAGIEANVIQELDDEIERFKKIIEKAGEEGRNKLIGVKVDEVLNEVPRTAGKVDPANWSALGEDKQKELYDRLILVRDALHSASELDGPTNPKHIMYAEYASTTAIVIWTSLGFLLIAFLLYAIALRWNQATGIEHTQKNHTVATAIAKPDAAAKAADKAKTEVLKAKTPSPSAQNEKISQEAEKTPENQDKEAAAKQSETTSLQPRAEKEGAPDKPKTTGQEPGEAGETNKPVSEGSVLIMVILLGALGGSIHLVSSLVKYVGNRQLKRSWLLYYLAMPFTGAGLAPIVYMLLRVGLINPSGRSSEGTAIASLNLIAIYAFAALTGMFSKAATEKLGELFNTMFRTETRTKDALGSKKPPDGAAPTAGKAP